ncbi:MAG TPA: hypothetical protein VLQ48_14630 [Chloroflexia bacterium]|nr:hypothetical protein [Chloroflexia bacterium]
MQLDFLSNLSAWAFSLLVYPGLLFAVLLALVGRWLAGLIIPLFMSKLYRQRTRIDSFFGPLLIVSKLLGRKTATRWQPNSAIGAPPTDPSSNLAENMLVLVGAIASLIALALMPMTGNPVTEQLGTDSNLFLILVLLAVYPLVSVAVQARTGGLSGMSAMQSVGALLTGLLPTLLIVVALMQVASSHTLSMTNLLAAPDTPQQTFVRVLAGVGLLVALPWWLGGASLRNTDHLSTGSVGAGLLAGRLVQTTALSALWSLLVLPMPGDTAWSYVVPIAGTLFACVASRLLADLWVPTRRLSDAANLAWATTLPVAVLAFLLGLFVNS